MHHLTYFNFSTIEHQIGLQGVETIVACSLVVSNLGEPHLWLGNLTTAFLYLISELCTCRSVRKTCSWWIVRYTKMHILWLIDFQEN